MIHGFSNLMNFENIYRYLLLSILPISWFMTFAKHSRLLRFDEDYYEEFINLYLSQGEDRASFIRKKVRRVKRKKKSLKK